MNPRDELDPVIAGKLKVLDDISERSSQRAADGKAAFLNESVMLKKGVSPEASRRHKNWKEQPNSNFLVRRKELKPMISTVTSIILAIALLLGGSGVTVAAAQASVPGDLLYDLKLLSEDAVMGLTADPEAQLDLTLNLLDRRADEIQTLLDSGEVITDDVQTQYRDQIEEAIMLALNLPEGQVVQAFERIQTRLQTEEQIMLQTHTNGSETALMSLTQLRDTIQERLQILENGQANLLQIQEQLQNQEQINNPDQKSTNAPTDAGSDTAPGTGDGNPWTTGTPTPGSGYGSGEGSNPWTTGTPTPGSGYGSGEAGAQATDMVTGEDTAGNGNASIGGSGNGGNTTTVYYYTPTLTRTPRPSSSGNSQSSGNQGGNR